MQELFQTKNGRVIMDEDLSTKMYKIKHYHPEKADYLLTDKVMKYLSSEYDGRKIQKNVCAKIKTFDKTSKCLGCGCGDYGNNTGLIIQHDNGVYYGITPLEAERLQTLPDNYTEGIPPKKRFHVIGNGWTVDVIAHIFKGLKSC